MQQTRKQSFDVTDLLTAFPSYFSMQASLHFMGLSHTFRYRLVCCITYDEQIDFMVKGPLGIVLIRGAIGKKGVTVVDQLQRVVYQWNYQQIKEKYHVSCNYPLMQSLLLGTVTDPIAHRLSTPDSLCSDIVYTYDDLTGKVIAAERIDTKQGNFVKVLYQHKMEGEATYLSGIKISFSLSDKKKLYQGKAALHKLHFKALKKPNIKLTIPPYYRKNDV
ncbi:DUF4292 domain-containing protein [Cardinium endosymbiont of Nabis limbatus]|uniref:DUF4292 domain-containing protein n=1 Tax=Cardinium endosymbiont of Nabis limbatus TaxID=3066217 RepID=UPI003AF34CB6